MPECRYYKRVILAPTTRCGGVVLCLGLLLPRPCGAQPSTGADVPTTVAAPSDASESLPAWSTSLDLPRAPVIAASADVIVLSGAGSEVSAYDGASGQRQWRVALDAAVPAAIASGRVAVQTAGAITVLDATSGRELWSHAAAEPSVAPALDATRLFALSATEVRAYAADDGRGLWRIDFEQPVTAPLVSTGTRLFLALGDGTVAGLDAVTGRVLWRRAIGGRIETMRTADDLLAFSDTQGICRTLWQADGTEAWHFDVRLPPIGAPAVDRTHVYVAFSDATLRAFDRRRGNLRWLRPLPWRPFAGPDLVTPRLVVPLANATIAALEPGAGTLIDTSPSGGSGPAPIALESVAVAADAGRAYMVTFSQTSRFVLSAVALAEASAAPDAAR